MPSHLSSLTKSAETLTTSDGRVIDVWELKVPSGAGYLSDWASTFRQHYCADSEIDALRAGTKLSRAEYLTELVFPDKSAAPGPGIRAGDFAELLVSDYVEHLLGYWVPRGKYADKASRDESANREFLLSLDSNEGWLAMAWDLFEDQSDDKFFHTVEPRSLGIQLASRWLQGLSYQTLFEHVATEGGTKPWGSKRRRLMDDDILEFCENTLGFQCSLILAAVSQFLFGENAMQVEGAKALMLFQKALKYGLPDWLPISCLELGFADRVVAQQLCHAVREEGYAREFFAGALASHRDSVEETLRKFPSYFGSVLAGRN